MKITINGLNEIMKMADKFPAVAQKYVDKAIQMSLLRVRTEAKNNAPFGTTGNLRSNWKIQTSPFYGRLSSEANNEGFHYGVAVEYGTRPHYVSPKILDGWARRRGLNPFAVSKSIAKKGTKANPFFRKSIGEVEPKINQEFDKALELIVKEI
jgi:HK97 gp10 family phage protein